MPELTEPWDDADAERDVLLTLVLPAAQAQHQQALHRWSALDAKAFGLVGVAAAVVGGLAAAHDSLHWAWWMPALGCVVAGAFFVSAVRRRSFVLGADLIDYHDEMRRLDALGAVRTMVELVLEAVESVEEGYEDKGWNFEVGLAILTVSLVGCLPVVLFRP